MKKLINWLNKKILPWLLAFLIVFIPLYPKLPLLDIAHTWVYIRLEDFFVLLTFGIWLLGWITGVNRVSKNMSFAIIQFWLVGLFSTMIAIVFIFPKIADVFPAVAILHWLRRIEYLSLFFVGFTTIKKDSDIYKYIIAGVVSLLGVTFYAFGQRFLGFPAFLTMNEEFAKGVPLYLPVGARITSTFAGHYDFAAYLVLTIALIGSLVFATKKLVLRLLLLFLCFGALFVLLLTASRVSFAVYLVTIVFMLFLQKKKIWIIPVVLFSFLMLSTVKGTAERFIKTFRIQPVVINTQTGQPIAVLENLPPELSGQKPTQPPVQDSLPLGTGFIGLPPVAKETPPEATTVAVIKKHLTSLKLASISSEISTISGSFLIQKAFVYDISFTTRLQGGWPRAWKAFLNNPFTGSGYSSISLASDNDYLRALGETGIIGFLSFVFVFATFFLILRHKLSDIKSGLGKSFAIGVCAGIVGLSLNALLIDVFEASKVAYILWALMGITVGIAEMYNPKPLKIWQEIKTLAVSKTAVLIYLFFIALFAYNAILQNYFSGNDFIWLKWAAQSKFSDLWTNFLDAEGFFYRPLPKLLYFVMYAVFWLKPFGYHFVSIFLFFAISSVLYLFGRRFLSSFGAFLASIVFIFLPVNAESVAWVSSYSGLLAVMFLVLGLLFYLSYQESGKKFWFLLAAVFYILGLLSHESMIVFPILAFVVSTLLFNRKTIYSKHHLWLIGILGVYLFIRYLAGSHWLSGDYSFNFYKLPFNVAGNVFGYLSITLFGPGFIVYYNLLREGLRSNLLVAAGILLVLTLAIWFAVFKLKPKRIFDKNTTVLSTLYLVSLIPYLGLGNISERYALLSTFFFSLLLVYFLEKIKERIRLFWLKPVCFVSVMIVLVFYQTSLSSVLNNWKRASETAKKIVYAVKDNYKTMPKNTTLFFVNLPIREKRAWIFPAGLLDALWFIYRDKTLKVVNSKTDDMAREEAKRLTQYHIFVFDKNELKETRFE